MPGLRIEREPVARAGLPPKREWAWVLMTMALASAGAILVLELWRANLRVPFSDAGDGSYFLALIKGVAAHGWYQHNPDLGAPFGQTLYDFPEVAGDHLQVLAIRLMALFSKNPSLLMNAYYLLSFPLIAGVSFLALRRLGITRGASLLCATLFSLAPYHLEKGSGQVFLASYLSVAIAALLMLLMFAAEPLFPRRTGTPGLRGRLSRSSLGTLGLCVVIGMTGLYYAVFCVLLTAIAGALRALHARSWRHGMPALVIVVAVSGTLLLNAAPNILYRLEHGKNAAALQRSAMESELYATKLTYLLLPISGHRISAFADLTARYDATTVPPLSEAGGGSLGTVGDVGLLVLFGVLLLAAAFPVRPLPQRLRHASVLAAAAFGLGTVGGVSALFGYVITPNLRGWNRISPYIAFFALLAVAVMLDRLRWRIKGRGAYVVLLAAILVLAVLDQSSPRFVPAYARIATAFNSDARLVSYIEHTLPHGSRVFELPIASFPEAGSKVGGQIAYDNERLYLHSHHLRWSYGAVRGRASDWQAALDPANTGAALRAAALAGFGGLVLDRIGYAQPGAAIAKLQSALRAAPVASPNGRFFYWDIRAYAQALRASMSPVAFDAARLSVLHPAVIEKGPGVYPDEQLASSIYNWLKQSARFDVHSSVARNATFSGKLTTFVPAHATLAYPDGSRQQLTILPSGTRFKHLVRLRAGDNTLRLSTDAPRVVSTTDRRDLHVKLISFLVR